MNILKKITKVFGDPNVKELKKVQSLIKEINELEKGLEKLSPEEIKEKTYSFREELSKGKQLNDILPLAFALCREAGKRTIGQRAFDTQLIGGIGLHQGKIVEMKTGEGKTLAAVFAAYLNALSGKGVHIITVNDYLARRDTNWMGSIYDYLGLTVGCVQHENAYLYEKQINPDQNEVSIEYENLNEVSKREAYKADITYGTNNEFGFDYLRDNMVAELGQMVQVRNLTDLAEEEKRRKKESAKIKNEASNNLFKKDYLNFAIVDEVDSILIDEARTPLIISAPDVESAKLYLKFSKIVPQLTPDSDYNLDEKMQAVTLTDKGITQVEKILGIENLYSSSNISYVHHLQQALKAHAIFKKDKQYVVKNGEVIIVDDFTGRLMPGRRFSEGLHQALEAKEGVKIQRESKTLATITFQNFFRLYSKLSGMTGTALTSAEEFSKVYSLDVLSVPTCKEMIREDRSDKIYKNEHGKLSAVAEEIKSCQKKGQPVLVGTISVEKSERLSHYLDAQGINYEILNAKNHEREAQIISKAGEKESVTVATNMAGRGTDIKLGKGVAQLGGLHVIGTERHEARRIDNQLRGRSGRQGDQGSSQFFVSLEDELMRRFGSDKIKHMMDTLGLPEDQAIQNKMISRSIESAQKKIEGYNFDIRKHVLDYDDVINRQREVIYQKRRENLLQLTDKEDIEKMLEEVVNNFVTFHTNNEDYSKWNKQEIYEHSQSLFNLAEEIKKEIFQLVENQEMENEEKRKKIKELIIDRAKNIHGEKEKAFGKEIVRKVERIITLRTLDSLWMEHLDNMQQLREGIGLRGYGQRDPLIEYKKEGFQMFQELLKNIKFNTIANLYKTKIQTREEREREEEQKENSQLNSALAKNFLENKTPEKKDNSFTNNLKEESPGKLQEKIGRNDPCPCGSGKKYKKCCGGR